MTAARSSPRRRASWISSSTVAMKAPFVLTQQRSTRRRENPTNAVGPPGMPDLDTRVRWRKHSPTRTFRRSYPSPTRGGVTLAANTYTLLLNTDEYTHGGSLPSPPMGLCRGIPIHHHGSARSGNRSTLALYLTVLPVRDNPRSVLDRPSFISTTVT